MAARAMKEEAEKENRGRNPNNIFKFVKSMQKDGKDVKDGQCIKDKKEGLVCQQ